MSSVPHSPPVTSALGVAALAMGLIGIMVFPFFPVLGIPVSGVGLVLGLIGLAANRSRSGAWRWAVAGSALAFVALGLSVMNWLSPSGLFSRIRPPHEQQGVSEQRPAGSEVPPNAPPPER